MAKLSLALLGSPLVERDDAPVAFDTRKAVALLALLAVTGREHSRERLAALLWPDADDSRARASLRRTLSVTAAAMGDALVVRRPAVALQAELVRVDVADFAALIAQPDTASLERGVRLYRDDFLAGFVVRGCPDFDAWQSATADKLRLELTGALERLVTACIHAGQLDRALDHASRWLSLDPLHEPAHQALIRLYGWTGQRSAAVRQYRACMRVLERELAVRPLQETTALYDDVRAGRLGPAPEPAAVASVSRPAVQPAAVRPSPAVSAAWPLVGRAAELGLLEAAWLRATRAGQAVAVVGEAGSGKTRLVEEFRAGAQRAGAAAVVARCHDGESQLPFVLATDLLRSASAACPGLSARLPGHVAAMTGRLTPEMAEAHRDLPTPPLDSPLALTRMYAAVGAALLAAVRGDRGGSAGIVVVEDVHWADGPSLDLLAFLVRRLSDWPALLVLTWCRDDAERLRGLKAALDEAARAGLGEVIEPAALGISDIAELLAAGGEPRLEPVRLLAETRGLPVLVREYAEALRSPGNELAPDGADSDRWPPPPSVRELLGRRLSAISEPTRQSLSAAAVLGGGFDVELLRAVSGRGEAETVEALDEALGRSLLTEVAPNSESGTPSYEFPYHALHRVTYDFATLARRRLLHGRAADVLARRHERDPVSTPAAVVAEHLRRAGRDTESAGWWWRAAEGARELYAHSEALAHLRRAVALGYPFAAAAVALGDVLTVLGRYREALAEFEAAAAGSGGDDAALAAIEHKLADVHHRLGDWELADAHLEVALDLLPAENLQQRARLEADRAVVGYRRGAYETSARLAGLALTHASEAGDEAAVAHALNVLGMLASCAGDAAMAEDRLRQSLGRARRLDDYGLVVAVLNNLARLLADVGRGGEALVLAEEALAVGSELGDQHRVAALHTNLADLLHASGQRDTALQHLKEAARRFAAVDGGGPPRPEIWTLVEW